jgi:predicted SAM-dependent methyltransferase
MNKLIKHSKNKLFNTILSLGSGRECPICGWTGYCFFPFGIPNKRRFDAQCPGCGSLERHRLAFVVAKKVLHLSSLDTLHVAPEASISPWLQSVSRTYVSIDLYAQAMRKMDLRRLEFEDESFSLIWCSNVLEHILEDNLAIQEMHRVCRLNGIVFIQVPIWVQTTYENDEVKSEKDRLEHFYQKDHVRLYGLDIVDRFEEIGFVSRIVRAQDFGPKAVLGYSLSFISTNEVFVFKKGNNR